MLPVKQGNPRSWYGEVEWLSRGVTQVLVQTGSLEGHDARSLTIFRLRAHITLGPI